MLVARGLRVESQIARMNYLLEELASEERESLRRYGTEINLLPDTVLYEAGDQLNSVYFVYDGVISLLTVMPNGSIAETGFVGSEGAVGTNYDAVERISFTRALIVASGTALRVPFDHFERILDRSGQFRDLISQNNNRIAQRAQQIAACNLLHHLEARVCRWLLQIVENSVGVEVVVTQDSLAQMLGVNRARLNEALKTLHGVHAITQPHRGALRVINPSVIAERVCDCYRAMHSPMPPKG